jgi:hypothetical protein
MALQVGSKGYSSKVNWVWLQTPVIIALGEYLAQDNTKFEGIKTCVKKIRNKQKTNKN